MARQFLNRSRGRPARCQMVAKGVSQDMHPSVPWARGPVQRGQEWRHVAWLELSARLSLSRAKPASPEPTPAISLNRGSRQHSQRGARKRKQVITRELLERRHQLVEIDLRL